MLKVVLAVGFVLFVGWAIIKIAKLIAADMKNPPCSPLEDLDKDATEVATKKADIKKEVDATQEKINDINKKIN